MARSIRPLSMAEENRFYSSALHTQGCWLWTESFNDRGYGRFFLGKQAHLAHRVAYMLANGSFDWNLHVCHKCDNPACVKPDHLFLGTDADNQQDAMRKGRHMCQNYDTHRRRGTEQHLARLNDDIVRAIRVDKDPQRVIAKKYGTTQAQVWRIKNRQAWAHVSD